MTPIPGKHFGKVIGGNLEYATAGTGRATVIFLNGGGPANMDSWGKVYPQVAQFTRVLAYNRFGDGNSDQVSELQTGARVVDALRQLLAVTQCSAPFILVGHSMGGLYANLFARLYPEQVVGVVLVDSAHPDQGEMLRSEGGIFGAVNRLLFKFYTKANPAKSSELTVFEETAAQIKAAGPFPNVLLTVLSAGKRFSLFVAKHTLDTIERQQQELAQLSPQGKQIIAQQSGHYIQHSQPDLVIAAIQEIIDNTVRPQSPAT
jgi:pimeloyl-ACP methyl ester carboxylesterase